MLRPLLAASVALLALLATGCESDGIDQDPDPVPPSAEVLAGLAALYAGTDPSEAEVREAACFADALAERLSVEELKAAELVQDDGTVTTAAPMLDVDTATAWVDAQASCVPFAEVSTRALAVQSKGKLDEAAYRACFEGAITDDELRTALIATLTGGFSSPEVAVLSEAQATCAEDALPTD